MKKDVKYRNSAGVLVFNELGELLLLKKIKNGLRTAAGGKAEEGETFLECATRELKEETGIENIELEFFTYTTSFTNGVHWKEVTYIGRINNETKIKNIEKDIFSEMKFFKIENIPELSEIEAFDHDLIRMLKGKKEVNMSFEEIE